MTGREAAAEALAEAVWDALDGQHDRAWHVHAAECCWSFPGATEAIRAALLAAIEHGDIPGLGVLTLTEDAAVVSAVAQRIEEHAAHHRSSNSPYGHVCPSDCVVRSVLLKVDGILAARARPASVDAEREAAYDAGLTDHRAHDCCTGRVAADREPDGLRAKVIGVSRMIDSTYPADLDAEAHMWRRCMKVAEECGEATGAILGLLGENPRKGRTHTPEQVRGELLDVALAALGAVAYLTGNGAGGDPVRMFGEHASIVHDRLAAALLAHPATDQEEWKPRTGTVEDDLRSRLGCVMEATYWDRPYEERIAAIQGMCDLTTDGMTATDQEEADRG